MSRSDNPRGRLDRPGASSLYAFASAGLSVGTSPDALLKYAAALCADHPVVRDPFHALAAYVLEKYRADAVRRLIEAGVKPAALLDPESAAYDVCRGLVRNGQLAHCYLIRRTLERQDAAFQIPVYLRTIAAAHRYVLKSGGTRKPTAFEATALLLNQHVRRSEPELSRWQIRRALQAYEEAASHWRHSYSGSEAAFARVYADNSLSLDAARERLDEGLFTALLRIHQRVLSYPPVAPQYRRLRGAELLESLGAGEDLTTGLYRSACAADDEAGDPLRTLTCFGLLACCPSGEFNVRNVA